jgi:hypothetical protein
MPPARSGPYTSDSMLPGAVTATCTAVTGIVAPPKHIVRLACGPGAARARSGGWSPPRMNVTTKRCREFSMSASTRLQSRGGLVVRRTHAARSQRLRQQVGACSPHRPYCRALLPRCSARLPISPSNTARIRCHTDVKKLSSRALSRRGHLHRRRLPRRRGPVTNKCLRLADQAARRTAEPAAHDISRPRRPRAAAMSDDWLVDDLRSGRADLVILGLSMHGCADGLSVHRETRSSQMAEVLPGCSPAGCGLRIRVRDFATLSAGIARPG